MAALVAHRGAQVSADWPERIAEAQKVTHYTSCGKPYPRVRFGEDDPRWGEVPCRDCAVVKGEFHVPDCPYEHCPVCKSELLQSCDCAIQELGLRHEPASVAGGLLSRASVAILLAVVAACAVAVGYWALKLLAVHE
jgi:hypothetical protein